jgi:ribosomal protein L24E
VSILVLATEHPVARKLHTCQMCSRLIAPGERYTRQRAIGDDGPYVWKECAHCSAMVDLLDIDWHDYQDEGWGPDAMFEYDPDTVKVMRLKALWRKRWTRRDGSLYPIPVGPDQPEEQPALTCRFCGVALRPARPSVWVDAEGRATGTVDDRNHNHTPEAAS